MQDYLMLDVGGTFIKTGGVRDGKFYCDIQVQIAENGTRDEIVGTIAGCIARNPARHVAISIPGPMDYKTGTSHMKHKFAAIDGLSLKVELEKVLPDCSVSFLHDAAAFLLGEAYDGSGDANGCFAGSMLGTGLGFGVVKGGRVQMRTVLTPAIPLWSVPFLNGICEDYVSARAIRAAWRELTGRSDDVREICEKARDGDAAASALLNRTGENFGEMMERHLKLTNVEYLVVGGQIAKSWDLLADGFAAKCSVPVRQAAHLDDAALRGAYVFAQYGMDALYDIVSD